MGSIIFVPGILGSRLYLRGEEVWPPTPMEARFGYRRVDALLDPDVTPGDPIDAVLCFDVYACLLADLSAIADGTRGAPPRGFHAIGYDWRRDLRESAETVAAHLDGMPPEDRDEIRFVGHSMGCLVIRLILESGLYRDRPWFPNIRTFVALAGPHRGAPAALVRAAGLEGSTGLAPEDIRRIAADPRYPALYQLLPAPGVAAAWNVRDGRMAEVDVYDREVTETLGLDPANLEKAREVHAVLGANDRPGHVEYVYLAGSGKDTWLRVDLAGSRVRGASGREAGDGTVPLWSAIDPSCLHHAAPAAHAAVFKNEQVRDLLHRALGARAPAVMFSLDGKPALRIVVAESVYAQGTPVDASIVPVVPARAIRGEVVLAYSDAAPAPVFTPVAGIPLACEGLEIEKLDVRFPAPARSGFYKVTFEGSHPVAAGGEPLFAVSAAGGGP